jgi:hypothetical protein
VGVRKRRVDVRFFFLLAACTHTDSSLNDKTRHAASILLIQQQHQYHQPFSCVYAPVTPQLSFSPISLSEEEEMRLSRAPAAPGD